MATLTESRIASKVKDLTKQMDKLYQKADVKLPDEWWTKFEADLMRELGLRPIANMQISMICATFHKRFEQALRAERKRCLSKPS